MVFLKPLHYSRKIEAFPIPAGPLGGIRPQGNGWSLVTQWGIVD